MMKRIMIRPARDTIYNMKTVTHIRMPFNIYQTAIYLMTAPIMGDIRNKVFEEKP